MAMLRRACSIFAVMCLTDMAAVFAACVLGVTVRVFTGGGINAAAYLAVTPWLLIFPLLYLIQDLYSATFLRRPEEIKRLSIATSIGFMILILFTFLTKEGETYSRMAFSLAWGFAIIFVPSMRYILRSILARRRWWQTPCIVFAHGGRQQVLLQEVARAAHQGVYPAVLVLGQDDPTPEPGTIASTTEIVRVDLAFPQTAREELLRISKRYPRCYALIALGNDDSEIRQKWLNILDICFQRIIVIPDLFVGARVWVRAVTIGNLHGVLLRQNLLDPRRMVLKRAIDLLLTLVFGVFLLLLVGLIAVLIKLDSRGPAFFRHKRIGKGGKLFKIHKFRTMKINANELLRRHLEENPQAKAEWEATQKLKNDPRITRLGKLLRKTSLDELPQVLNVFKGQMSLVGPRPIVESEIEKYGEDFALYTRVRPGITGLWQISGRNNTTYAYRVWLDKNYVCNWSVWLDILIIIRTVPVVLRGIGAY